MGRLPIAAARLPHLKNSNAVPGGDGDGVRAHKAPYEIAVRDKPGGRDTGFVRGRAEGAGRHLGLGFAIGAA